MALDRMLVGQQLVGLLARNPTAKIDSEDSAHRDALARDAVRLAVSLEAACAAHDATTAEAAKAPTAGPVKS